MTDVDTSMVLYSGHFLRKMGTFCLLSVHVFSCLFTPISLAATTNNAAYTLAQTDIVDAGMDMFTDAYNWEVGSHGGYVSDAFLGFSKKLNAAIKNKKTGIPALITLCGNCDEVINSGFDSALATYYRETPPDMTNAERAYFSVAKPYFHQKIQSGSVSTQTVNDFETLVRLGIAHITTQVREQMDTFRDVAGMGLYYDGDVENSSYDILDDIRRIDEIFFREAPKFGDYKNTSRNSASALITGEIQQGSWIGTGENYHIDFLSDIKESLSGGDEEDGSASTSDGEVAGDCESGYCVTVDFIENTHYFLGGANSSGSSQGETTFQGLFEEALEWFIKNGDKRNFACKQAPTIFQYETNNDMNLELSEIFSGLGIYLFWKTPKFLTGLLRKDSTGKEEDKEKNASQEEERTKDDIKSAYRAEGLDYDRPHNLKSSREQSFLHAGLVNSSTNQQPAINYVESIGKTKQLYQQILKEESAVTSRANAHEHNVKSVKHLEKIFDELVTRMRLVRQLSEDLNKILKYLKDKPDCTN